MIALATTLLLFSSSGLSAGWLPLAAQQNTQSTGEKKPDPFRNLRTELAAAQLELTQLNAPQKALDRCNAVHDELGAFAGKEGAQGAGEEWSNLALAFMDLRAAALAAGATSDAAVEAKWTSFAAAANRPRAVGDISFAPLSIDDEIEQNARLGNADFVIQLGERAVPGVLRALKDGPREQRITSKDPLYMLMMIDPVAADGYVGEHNASGDPSIFWDVRFARAVASSSPFSHASAWTDHPTTPGSTKLPHILKQCDRLLSEPQLFNGIGPALKPIASRGFCTDGMLAYMDQSVDRGGELPNIVSNWWHHLGAEPRVRQVMLRALASGNSTAAKQAKQALRRAATNDGVYEVILQGSTKQRHEALEWLNLRAVALPSDPSGVPWSPEYGAAEAAFVDALLQDPDATVRAQTVQGLASLRPLEQEELIGGWSEFGIHQVSIQRVRLPIPLSDATLQALATDESRVVRLNLANYAPRILEHRQLAAMAAIMGNDPVLDISHAALASLAYLDWHRVPGECVELVGEGTASLTAYQDYAQPKGRPLDALLHSQEGLEVATRWAIERNDMRLTRFVALRRNMPRPQLAKIPAELWATFVAHLMQVQKDGDTDISLDQRKAFAMARSDEESRAAAVHLAASGRDLSADSIFGLLRGAAVADVDEAATAMMALLRAKKWHESPGTDSSPLSRDINRVINRYPDTLRNRVAEALIEDPELPPLLVSRCFTKLDLPFTKGALEYAVANTDRLHHRDGVVQSALGMMSREPDLVDIEWIQKVARKERFAESALEVMGKLRSPEFLPFLAEFIKGPSSRQYYRDAVAALGNYMSDEAAGLLLIAARNTSDDETRAKCLEQVEEIAALQDAEARWSTRNLEKATRDVTVSKLMGLLKDSDNAVRVEAIKGLGTWEAVEAMPELIELLKDPSAEVSAEARKTLALFNQRR